MIEIGAEGGDFSGLPDRALRMKLSSPGQDLPWRSSLMIKGMVSKESVTRTELSGKGSIKVIESMEELRRIRRGWDLQWSVWDGGWG